MAPAQLPMGGVCTPSESASRYCSDPNALKLRLDLPNCAFLYLACATAMTFVERVGILVDHIF